MADELYRPGESVPHCGIYLVTHEQHREPHEALVTDGQHFPACRVCGGQVRYRVLRGAHPIEADHDFTASGRPR